MIGFYASLKIPFSIAVHAAIPEDSRPTFLARFVVARQQIELDTIIRTAVQHQLDAKNDEALAEFLKALHILLAGWKNVTDDQGKPVEFDVSRLPDLLTFQDIWSILTEGQNAIRAKVDDLKKSASPSPSAGEGSANPAAASTAAGSA